MKLLLSCLVALSTIGSAFAGDAVIGQKIIQFAPVNTTASLPFTASIWANDTGSWIAIKKIQYCVDNTSIQPGPYWVVRIRPDDPNINDILVMSTVVGGATNDFSPDYFAVKPGDQLWAVIGSGVPSGVQVVIWYTKISQPQN